MPPLELPSITQFQDPSQLTDGQIRAQFADVKRLMREDPADYKLAITKNTTKLTKRKSVKPDAARKLKRKKARSRGGHYNNGGGGGGGDDDDDSDYE